MNGSGDISNVAPPCSGCGVFTPSSSLFSHSSTPRESWKSLSFVIALSSSVPCVPITAFRFVPSTVTVLVSGSTM